MNFLRAPRNLLAVSILIILSSVPVVSTLMGQPFYMTFFLRIMIYALAALSLNMILGYGGLVAFGHALYIGIGAYSVGILVSMGVTNGWIHLGAAVLFSLTVAILTGAISLRVTGIPFIMITLAFAQMFFFLAISLRQFGGDEGMTIPVLSNFILVDFGRKSVFYYAVFSILLFYLYFIWRLINSRFGMVLRGSKGNDRRMNALGFPTFRYRLAAYSISAVMCALAGVLLANLTGFASPDYMAWSLSGELIVMVVLGGIGTLMGPVVGAMALMILEETLSLCTDHRMIVLGPMIVFTAIIAKRGIVGLFSESGGERR
jgi:branched-chain amino acid transport system permease protein